MKPSKDKKKFQPKIKSNKALNPNAPKSRKELRKEKRKLKKIHKNDYFSKNKQSNSDVGKFVRAPVESDPEEHEEVENFDKKQNKSKSQNKNSSNDNLVMNELKGARAREGKLKEDIKKKYNSKLLDDNKEEDKIIKKLEKQLKMHKRKPGTIAKNFVEDGLGYLLEVCDRNTLGAAVTAEKHLAQDELGSDFEEDLALATGKTKTVKSKPKQKIADSKVFSSDDSISEGDFDEEFSGEEDEDDDEADDSPLEDENVEKNNTMVSKKKSTSENISEKPESASDDDSIDEDSQEDEEFLEDNSSEEDDEAMSEEDLSEDDEDIEKIYTGASGFPDESFIPGKFPSIVEETESDIEIYKVVESISSSSAFMNKFKTCNINEVETPDFEIFNDSISENNSPVIKTKSACSHNHDEVDDSMSEIEFSESDMSENSSPNIDKNAHLHHHHDESDEDMSVDTEDSDESEDDDECFEHCHHGNAGGENSNNKTIIINGKVVNTYGRHFEKETEPEIVRCPKLDKILDSISDSETEKETLLPLTEDKSKPKGKRKTTENEPQKKKMKLDEENLSNSLSEGEDDDEDESSEEIKKNDDGSWEDIYGRKRDKDGNIINEKTDKYIPPQLRNVSKSEDDKKMALLKRQIKGLLNKVAGSNMHWTSSQMENIYSTNSRNSVNSAFCSLWMSAIVQPTVTSERMACEHAMLVAILHANIGSEVGAYFLQTLVKKFDEMIPNEHDVEDKCLNNLILGLSELYSFKIFSSTLLYEILEKLVENLSEKTIDCLLICLRSVGAVLRKDDPAALKVFIHSTQNRAMKLQEDVENGARVKFLLEVLLAIKNNNMNKIPNYDPSYSEELKKALKGIIRKGNYVVPLNIKLEDLLKADERGRWWIVGSAWDGSSTDNKSSIKESSNKLETSQKLSELARKLRINTDIRRSIFFIIMSAEDYMDAFEKLQQLGLKNQQEREIIHILMVCCLQENTYNPYYSVLGQKFCDHDRKFQMTIQYNVWDKLKELDNFPAYQISNLAQFLTHLFIEKGLPISILKVVQFSDLNNSSLRLMRQILLALLLQKRQETCLEVFHRAALSPKLHLFRESLRLFISHFLLKNLDKKENILDEEQLDLLKERAFAVDKMLSEGKSTL